MRETKKKLQELREDVQLVVSDLVEAEYDDGLHPVVTAAIENLRRIATEDE